MRMHASCVSVEGRGVLITGRSGSGKSALALQLIALGAGLVADDQTELAEHEGQVIASAPDTLRGMIEARGIGILAADAVPKCRVDLVIDLDVAESERLPPERRKSVLGHDLALFHKTESAHFPAAIMLYLKSGKVAC